MKVVYFDFHLLRWT